MNTALADCPLCKLQTKWSVGNTTPGLSSDKHSSLLRAFVSYEENEVLLIRPLLIVPFVSYKENELLSLGLYPKRLAAGDKHSSLLGAFVSVKENEALWIQPLLIVPSASYKENELLSLGLYPKRLAGDKHSSSSARSIDNFFLTSTPSRASPVWRRQPVSATAGQLQFGRRAVRSGANVRKLFTAVSYGFL